MTVPGLVATDLDGTLVGDGYRITERSAAALRRVTAAGVPVVLVTGRPPRWLAEVYQQLGREYLAVCANGAAVYEPATDTLRDARPLAAEVLAELCARLRARIPGITFAVEVDGGRRMCHEPGYPRRWDIQDALVSQVDQAQLTALPAVKLLARSPLTDPDEFAARIHAVAGDLGEVTHSSSTGLAEISAVGVTKATGLALVADELGVPARDVLAFGDMPNDVPMLSWAGRSVAVANAHPAVRAVATDTTLSNVNDGVAVYLERLFPALV